MYTTPNFVVDALRSITGSENALSMSSIHYCPTAESWKQALGCLMADSKTAGRHWITLHAILGHAIYPVSTKNSRVAPFALISSEAIKAYSSLLESSPLARATLFYEAGRSSQNKERIGKVFVNHWLQGHPEFKDLWEDVGRNLYTLADLAKLFKASRKDLILPDAENITMLAACHRLTTVPPKDTWGSYALELLRLSRQHPGFKQEAVVLAARQMQNVANCEAKGGAVGEHTSQWATLLAAELTTNFVQYGEEICKAVRGEANANTPFGFFQVNPGDYRPALRKLITSVIGRLSPTEISWIADGHWHDDYCDEQGKLWAALCAYPDKLNFDQQIRALVEGLLSIVVLDRTRVPTGKTNGQQEHYMKRWWLRYPEDVRFRALGVLFGEKDRLMVKVLDQRLFWGVEDDYWPMLERLARAGKMPAWWVVKNSSRGNLVQHWINNLGERMLYSGQAELAELIIKQHLRAGRTLADPKVAKPLLENGYRVTGSTAEACNLAEAIYADSSLAGVVWEDKPWWRDAIAKHAGFNVTLITTFLGLSEAEDAELLAFFSAQERTLCRLVEFAIGSEHKQHELVPRARKRLEMDIELAKRARLFVLEKDRGWLLFSWPEGAQALLTDEQIREEILTNRTGAFSVEKFGGLFVDDQAVDRLRGRLLKEFDEKMGSVKLWDLSWAKWVKAFGFQTQQPFVIRLQSLIGRTLEVARIVA